MRKGEREKCGPRGGPPRVKMQFSMNANGYFPFSQQKLRKLLKTFPIAFHLRLFKL